MFIHLHGEVTGMTDITRRDVVKRIADEDETVEGLVADRTGLEKPTTFSGTADPNDRFCELCTYATSAGFIAPEYREGTAVCTTHAHALAQGDWEHGEVYDVVSIKRGGR